VKGNSLKIGSFSAGSNVTGVVPSVNAITALLHKNGAYSFWYNNLFFACDSILFYLFVVGVIVFNLTLSNRDFAAAAPHLPIDMNPVSNINEKKF
jgi:hypothetical protein